MAKPMPADLQSFDNSTHKNLSQLNIGGSAGMQTSASNSGGFARMTTNEQSFEPSPMANDDMA